MTDLVKWNIPAQFISERVALSGPEIAYGLRLEWLSLDDAVNLAGSTLRTSPTGVAPAAGPKPSGDPAQIEAWTRGLERGQRGDERRVWLFLGLAWLLANSASYHDPLEMIARIWEDFGHAQEIQHLVYWMPPETGRPVGVRGLERRWREFVDVGRLEYRTRSVP